MSLTPPIDDYPPVHALLYGAVRASIGAAVWLGRDGTWGGNSNWDGDGDYLVNNHEGEYAMIRFLDDRTCVGALHSGDPYREYDVAESLEDTPSVLLPALRAIVESPFLSKPTPLITALFWSESGRVVSNEPWETFYRFGANAIWNELTPDDLWLTEGAELFDFSRQTALVIQGIARRRVQSAKPIALTPDEVSELFTIDSPKKDEGLDTLRQGGPWAVLSR